MIYNNDDLQDMIKCLEKHKYEYTEFKHRNGCCSVNSDILLAQLKLNESEIKAKIIDEFAARLKAESFSGYVTLEDYCEDTVECVSVEDIDEVAEQLKAGGIDE